ncbi:MAG: hypothetical protein A3H68_03135 [Candidatus Taylorbacteria bacterium RIFCSPLOWO2_02_FULL_46_40]|uniref:PseI/NeuA/B-like domain-containing protein n=1 Tax=Candidatus Taylorbacteria bacterium RIFCSPLOWO2_02_FULL_46_40 TaxID=1802329 RepID=A0A1G2P1B7_9BACT|nr:MAG: hypothetical protein A3H68_03135 [Candidatus Taylorbacteria bacterium RIFCSPLOWO2_02_FULL_46_40]
MNIQIGNRLVGSDRPTFIVAEIGINHNGFIEVAEKLVNVAHQAGADAVKFQKRKVAVVYTEAELNKPRPVHRSVLENAIERKVLSPEAVDRLHKSNFEQSTNGDLKWALEFTEDEYWEIDRFCKKLGIIWFASPWDERSVDFLEQFKPPVHKIASASVTDDDLLRHIRAKDKPIIMSTGACNLPMIRHAVSVVGKENLSLLHCTSCYVKPVLGSEEMCKMVNLRAIETLQKSFPEIPIGFSNHFSGIMPAIEAAAMGASIIETHITLERSMVGSDQASSLEPHEFANLCRMAREFELLRGDGIIRIYPQEIEVMSKLRRKWSPEQKQLFDSYPELR